MDKIILIKRLTGSDRQKGDPDYRISYWLSTNYWWRCDIYPDVIKNMLKGLPLNFVHHTKTTIDKGESDALYHILESGGSSSVALLYNEYIHNNRFINKSTISCLPHLSSKDILRYIIALTIYNPHLLEWELTGGE